MIANVKLDWRSGAAVGIATVGFGTLFLALNVPNDELLNAIANAEYRPSRARLSGHLPYREYKPGPDFRLLRVALSSWQDTQRETVDDFRLAGVTALVSGQTSHAVSLLSRAADLADANAAVPRRKAEILNDLAVAHYELARHGSSKDLIIGLDVAQKAWTLHPTPVTAWTRAALVEELGGAAFATDAWNDYLKLDATSLWSDEVRRTRPVRAVPANECDFAEQVRHLAAWAEAVRGGDARAEAREMTALRSHAEARALARDTFLIDVVAWIDKLAKDPERKTAVANAILPLWWSNYRWHSLERARIELGALQSPLAIFADLSRASELVGGGKVDEASTILGRAGNVCTDRPGYSRLCARQRWIEADIQTRRGHFSDASIRYGQIREQFAQAGDTRCAARALLRRAALFDRMRATDEGWVDRVQAVRSSGSSTSPPDEAILTNVAITASRDGYFHAAEYLFSRETPTYRNRSDHIMAKYESLRRARWRTFAQMQIAGDPVDPSVLADERSFRLADSIERRWGQEAHANFASFRRDVVNVSVEGFGAITIQPRSDWTAPVDTFGPEHVEHDAIAAMVAESVQKLYRRESRTDVMYGSPEAALWLSDRARTVGVPRAFEPTCVGERRGRSPEELGRKLVDCVPQGITIVHQDLDFDRRRLYTWVVRRGEIQLTSTRVDVPALIADIRRFSGDITHQVNAASVRTQAQHLYDVLLRPVHQQLTGTELLVYSPAQELRGLSVSALHDGMRLLIERQPIVTTPTISMFELDRRLPAYPSALVVLPLPGDARDVLHGATSEVRDVAEVYQQRSILLTEAAASPARFLESVPSHDIIHIATHGQTRGGPYQNFIEFGQKRIRAYDIFTLHLKKKPIVMLAACRTADSSGGSMNIGLTDAFLAAGASAVVGSLWDVEDWSTEELSVAFHRELARGATPHDALRRVQIRLIRQGKPLSTWAAFQVSS